MIWIRSASWDAIWILSGVPLGAAFLACTQWGGIDSQLIVLWVILVTQTGHLLSPMALAWSHEGFRRIVWRQSGKYLMIPIGILAGTTLVAYESSFYLHDLHFNPGSFSLSAGPTTLGQLKNPFILMVVTYALWNAYHFGMQAFGVMSIYRHKAAIYGAGQRRMDMIYSCVVIWAAMLIPFIPRLAEGMHDLLGWPQHAHPFLDYIQPVYAAAAITAIVLMLWSEQRAGFCLPRILFILTAGLGMIMTFRFGLWGFAIIAVNHWLVAIGLSSNVYANHEGRPSTIFAVGLMTIGVELFCLLFVDLRLLRVAGFTVNALHFTVTTVGFRLGLGFVHFLYDRWVYKLSDARVRATVGRDI